jgi:hypothetical protein
MTAPANIFSKNSKTKIIKVTFLLFFKVNNEFYIKKVFFFVTPTKLEIPIKVDSKIIDIIKSIIDFYINDQKMDKSLMKYPNQPEGKNSLNFIVS